MARRGDDWKPPAPPAIVKTAEAVLAGLERPSGTFVAPGVVVDGATPSTPFQLLSTVGKMLDPAEADTILDTLLTLDEAVDPTVVNPKMYGGLTGPEIVLNPAFVRAAARRGAVYYFGSDRKIHRYTLSQEERRDLKGLTMPGGKDAVDPAFFWTPPWLTDLAAFVDRDDPTVLIGPAGCGKTEAVEQVFKARNQKLMIVSCTPSMTADDMEGKTDLVGGETKFSLASPAIACKEGHGLLLDEADACPAETLYSLYRILTKKDMHILRLGGDGVIKRHPEFRAISTQNTRGHGDDRGLHHGRAYQDAAFLDRIDQRIAVDYPEAENEVMILRRRTGISAAAAESIVNAAKALRTALAQDETMFVCSIRRTLAVARNIRSGMTPERAWQFAVVNGVEIEDGAKIREVLQRIYGTRLRMKPAAS